MEQNEANATPGAPAPVFATTCATVKAEFICQALEKAGNPSIDVLDMGHLGLLASLLKHCPHEAQLLTNSPVKKVSFESEEMVAADVVRAIRANKLPIVTTIKFFDGQLCRPINAWENESKKQRLVNAAEAWFDFVIKVFRLSQFAADLHHLSWILEDKHQHDARQ